MKYIDFSGAYEKAGKNHFKHKPLVDEWRAWLLENIGAEEQAWYWRRGDLIADGVYITNDEDAVLFKLRFEL
jgi:hypothetical protein